MLRCRGACADAVSFQVPAGSLLMEGPRLGQSLTCIRGQPCVLAVSGENLLAGERVMGLVDCGVPAEGPDGQVHRAPATRFMAATHLQCDLRCVW